MKKVLFTLVTLLAAGLTAFAADVPMLGFSENEITVTPGGDPVEVKIMLTADGTYGPILAFQFQWTMFNSAHEELADVVTLQQTNIGTAFKPNWVYFTAGVAGGADGLNLIPSTTGSKKDANYRMLVAAGDGSDVFPFGNELELFTGAGMEPSLYVIKVAAAEGWDEEYATLELTQTEDFQSMWNIDANTNVDHYDQICPMVLRIKNANYVPPVVLKDFQGDVTVTVDENGNITAVYNAAEDEDVNPTVTVTPNKMDDYGTIDVVVTVEAEGYNTKTYDKTATWTQPVATPPVINLTQASDGGVNIEVSNYTSYVVYVDDVAQEGEINYVAPDYDVVHVVRVVATNANPAGAVPATAEKTMNTLPKAYGTLLGNITFGPVDQATGKVHVVYTGEEAVTMTITCTEVRDVFTINGNEGDIQLPHYGTFTLVGTAKAAYYNDKTSEAVERTWNAPQVYTVVDPTVEGNQTATAYEINVTNNDPYATVTLYVTTYDPETGAPTTTSYTEFPVTFPRTAEDQYISYYATATLEEAPAGYDDWNNATTQPKQVIIEALPTLQGEVVVNVDDNGHVTATYVAAEGEEEIPVTVTVTPENLTQYGEDIPVTVTVTAEGYQPLVVNTTVDYTEPVTPPAGKTNSPSVNKYNDIVYDGPGQCHNEYHISYTNAESDPDATIYYAVGVGTYDEATDTWTFEYQTDDEGNIVYMEYVDELIYTTVGTYEITAYAQTQGKEKSDPVIDRFTVASTTSIEELFADKTLANVRYYNLAGQEMQEANGICISVYTFTDGTQVAVKVMK